MGQALYRKCRPKSLELVVGQEHITRTLSKAITTGQISHAYLFTGPKGVGKTSVARILAHQINGLDYTDDSSHIDIIEIDAASNRRIDEIRELRERVYIAPAQAKYKVYIIDEVHMLTREAFNALLKILEEPPAHVVFILATTDAHRLPETIVSRTQRYSFKPLKLEASVAQLEQIAKTEKIKVSKEALQLIAEHGQGSLRDSISLLDQARSQAEAVEASSIMELLGLPPQAALSDLLNLTLASASPSKIITSLSQLYEQGYQAAVIARELGEAIRNKLISGEGLDKKLALGLLADLIEVPASHDPERYLEIALIKNTGATTTHISEPEVKERSQSPLETTVPEAPKPKAQEVSRTEATEEASPKRLVFNEAIWNDVLSALKQTHNTLYGVVRMAQPSFEDDKLNLAFAFEFHKKRLSEASNRKILSDVIKKLTGKNVIIECHLDKSAKPPLNKEMPETHGDELSTISSIFNGAELLES